ncbi:MmcQ/YjbR family DNA-binding protein [bacterium]|nr:MmcQ/YjbR family DNA-binding protein [bacterium]
MEILRAHALGLPGATEDFPFGPEVMTFKVGGKLFGAVAWEESPLRVSLKCDPDRAAGLRETHAAIDVPRYFDRRHWNQVTVDGTIGDALLGELIGHSYDLVRASLPCRVRDALEADRPRETGAD